MKIEIDNNEYDVIVEKKISTKNTYIRVKEDGKIYVTCNKFTTNIFIKNLINDNIDKIKKMLGRVEKKEKKKEYFYYLGKQYDIVYMNIKDISLGEGKILAAPSIATLNGKKAVVKLTHNYLYQTGVDRSSNPQFREQETGPMLEFTPIVGNDGYITITITIKTGDIVKFRTSGISEVPETANREATTQIRVRDGELFVLGGLYEHTKTKVTTGIPIISNIPLLGELFKNRSVKDNKSQLAFIAIPNILND